jgi:prepilin-type N-terminal cleavage/methylation domain-containing protein
MTTNMKRQKNSSDGFTLIELLVVISIISLLSTLTMSSLSSARQKSRDAIRLSDMRTVQIALELYYAANNAYPSTGGVFKSECLFSNSTNADVIPNLTPIYLSRIPSDPFMKKATNDNCYIYYSPDGVNYAFIDMGTDINLMSHPDFVDTARDVPDANSCILDGIPTAWKVSSPGGRCF